jgi:hypothetical protein
MKYTSERKYRDFIEEEEVSLKKNRPTLLNKKKNILDRIIKRFKGK